MMLFKYSVLVLQQVMDLEVWELWENLLCWLRDFQTSWEGGVSAPSAPSCMQKYAY